MAYFSLEEVVDFFKTQILSESSEFSSDDIKKRNAQAIAEVYHAFLLSLGFSSDMFLTHFQTLIDDIEPEIEELMREEDQRIKLYSNVYWLIEQIDYDEKGFSYRDICNPDPDRTVYFLGILRNFYLCSRMHYDTHQEIENEVLTLKGRKDQLMNDQQIENFEDAKRRLEDMIESDSEKLHILTNKEVNLNQDVSKLEAEAEESESVYAQELEQNNSVEKVLKTVRTITQVKEQVDQLEKELEEEEGYLVEVKKGCWDHPVFQHFKKIRDQQIQQPHYRSTIEERRGLEKELVREEKDLEKKIYDMEGSLETMMSNINNNKNKYDRRIEMKEKEAESLSDDLTRLSVREDSGEVRKLLHLKQRERAQLDMCDAELAELEEYFTKNNARMTESLEKFTRNIKSDFTKLKEAADNPPLAPGTG